MKWQAWMATQKLQFYTNVCGPMLVPLVNGNKWTYVNSISEWVIDTFFSSLMIPSGMCWSCFLKVRNEISATFRQIKSYVNPKGHCINILRYDNSPEYNSSQFDKFRRDERVKHQLTITYTPQ